MLWQPVFAIGTLLQLDNERKQTLKFGINELARARERERERARERVKPDNENRQTIKTRK